MPLPGFYPDFGLVYRGEGSKIPCWTDYLDEILMQVNSQGDRILCIRIVRAPAGMTHIIICCQPAPPDSIHKI